MLFSGGVTTTVLYTFKTGKFQQGRGLPCGIAVARSCRAGQAGPQLVRTPICLSFIWYTNDFARFVTKMESRTSKVTWNSKFASNILHFFSMIHTDATPLACSETHWTQMEKSLALMFLFSANINTCYFDHAVRLEKIYTRTNTDCGLCGCTV